MSLADIVEITADDPHRAGVQFEYELIHWLNEPPGRGEKVNFERQPEVGRMLWVLFALATSLEVSGMFHFLNSHGINRHFYHVKKWAKAAGATTTARYMAKAEKLIPDGPLPVDDEAAFYERVEDLDLNEEDLFLALDREYRDVVVEEIATCLREYVRTHQKEIEGAFAKLPLEAKG